MERATKSVESEEGRWRAVEAWRGRGGVGLVYFLALEGDAVAAGDDADRRASLAPGERLEDLEEGALGQRLERGTALTETERRFRGPDGDLWLAQSVGPVWAEGGVAGGLTGVVFTALEGEPRRLSGDGGHVGEMSDAELAAAWRAAAGDEDGGPDGGRSS